MRRTSASFCVLSCVLGLAGLVGLGACTTTNTVVHVTGDGGTAADPSTLPEVAADQLGAACSGFGTSIGDTALFTSDGCAAGVCLVDARSGLEEYCSADCNKVRCPTGYLCQATTLDPAKRACFKDPDAPATDAGTDAGPVSFLDERMTCFKKSSTAQTTLSLRDFADPTGATRDLVIVLVNGAWSTYDVKQLDDLQTSTYSRVEILSVLQDGAMPGGGATLSDLTKWHTKYSHVDTCLDSKLTQLEPGLGMITAVPSWFVFNARTMKQIATEQGYMDTTTLPGQIETWRTMAK